MCTMFKTIKTLLNLAELWNPEVILNKEVFGSWKRRFVPLSWAKWSGSEKRTGVTMTACRGSGGGAWRACVTCDPMSSAAQIHLSSTHNSTLKYLVYCYQQFLEQCQTRLRLVDTNRFDKALERYDNRHTHSVAHEQKLKGFLSHHMMLQHQSENHTDQLFSSLENLHVAPLTWDGGKYTNKCSCKSTLWIILLNGTPC